LTGRVVPPGYSFSRWTELVHSLHNHLHVRIWAGLLFVGLCAASAFRAAEPTPDTGACGPYPKNYRDIVWIWMQKNLVDPDSARIGWQGDPKCTNIGKPGQPEYGWLLNFTVNSRNRFGLYTGKQQHGVLIRNGEVVKGIGFGY
jgi:hypothetical protein